MTGSQPQSVADALAETLAALRSNAGMSQDAAASAAGVSQSSLSRAENGIGVLSAQDVHRLLETYGVVGPERDRLAGLAASVQAEFVPFRVTLQRGAYRFQRRLAAIEKRATHVRSFHPAAVLGVLQTKAYASVVFRQRIDPADATQAVQARLDRGTALGDTSRQWILLQTEGALEWALGGAEVMAEQLEHIAAVSRYPNVRIGVIRARTPAQVLPLHGFHLYRDDHWQASYGTRDGTALIDDPERVAGYRQLFADLEELAVFGDEARVVLARIAADYRAAPANP